MKKLYKITFYILLIVGIYQGIVRFDDNLERLDRSRAIRSYAKAKVIMYHSDKARKINPIEALSGLFN